MNAIRKTLKISSKGQITLPKAIRDRLKEDIVEVVSDVSGVHILPVPSAAGSLKAYAKKLGPNWDWRRERDEAWYRATERLAIKKPNAD
jgi:AbrB family looped-hinge helix DNA binding protein